MPQALQNKSLQNKSLQNKKIAIIVVAAGRGERASQASNGPKQYADINGRTVLARTIMSLQAAFNELQLPSEFQIVIHNDDEQLYQNAMQGIEGLREPVLGGASRQQSVFNGLIALANDSPDYVFIHDAARPFVDCNTIKLLCEALENGARACLPTIPVSDTVKKLDNDEIIATINRQELALAQTPQAFDFKLIYDLHERANDEGFIATDDISIAEHFNQKATSIVGNTDNFKLTSAQDITKSRHLIWAHESRQESRQESKMSTSQTSSNASPQCAPDIRMATAYDVHATKPGQSIILCGVEIASPLSLIGHSDADVALHALTDALLGTIADGDIGSHFPPSDEKWRGASSDQFLEFAVNRVRQQNGTINMLDVTIICEEPKIGPHRDVMRQSIAKICNVDVQRIAVKATTNEKIGFLGRGEGIAAIASATVFINSNSAI